MAEKIIVNGDEKDPFKYCMELEAGNILVFPKIPSEFSDKTAQFLSNILSPYANHWKVGEPTLSTQSDRLQLEAVANRPVHGTRVLRFFTNISQTDTQKWVTSLSFESLVQQFGGEKGVKFPSTMNYSLKGRLERKMKQALISAGVKLSLRSPYDHFMLKMGKFLKANESFQKTFPKDAWEFPPHSSWAFFTDQISYASAGKVVEQTYLIPQRALLCPEKSPVAILERLSKRNLVNIEYLFKESSLVRGTQV